MRKYLAYYENEWPANIAELTAIENKPFVGYLKGEGVSYTVIPKPVEGPANNEIWYTSNDEQVVTPKYTDGFGANLVSNTYENGKGVITFDGDVTNIKSSSFQVRKSLTSVTIPNSVTSIGRSAFSGCESLTSVTIPNSVTSIGSNAFKYCSSLTSVTIPNGVTTIEDSVFYGCKLLSSITIPESVTRIKNYSFQNCSTLTSITIPESLTGIGKEAFRDCYGLTSIIIPNSVTSIGEYAFRGCYIVKENFINNSSLDAEATNYWKATIVDSDIDGLLIKDNVAVKARPNIIYIVIPNSVTSIGDFAFQNCSTLKSITIPNSVTSIGSDALRSCSSLTSITIPNSVTSIGEWAFAYSSSLTSITFEGTMEEWNTVTKGQYWKTYVPATYVQCTDGQVAL